MKKTTFLSVLAGCSLISCAPKPKACMDIEPIIETYTLHTFTNCSDKADFYFWDFGNGFGREADQPEFRYEDAGNYNIKLTAYSKGGFKEDEVSQLTRVSERYLVRVELTPDTFAPNGDLWDTDGSGPDLKLEITGLRWGEFSPSAFSNVPIGTTVQATAPPGEFYFPTNAVNISVLELENETGDDPVTLINFSDDVKSSPANPYEIHQGNITVKIYWELR